MKNTKRIFFSLGLLLLIGSCRKKEDTVEISHKKINWAEAQQFYLTSITNSINYLEQLEKVKPEDDSARILFLKVRQEFKKAEAFASYLNPAVGHRINGPALPIFQEDNLQVLPAIGLQKIEESIYEGSVTNEVFREQLQLTRALMENLKENILNLKLTPERFFISTHQQLLRIISFSISGFDTPVSHAGIDEAAISLESLLKVYDLSIAGLIKKENKTLDKEFKLHIMAAVQFLNENNDFESFDRYTFIKDYVNPLTATWVAIRKESELWEGTHYTPFNFDAPTFFEGNSFNVKYFMPAVSRNFSKEQVNLGKKLFFDTNLSESKTLACATCHIPSKAYTDGMKVNLDNRGSKLKRNTPTLINSVFQKNFFWDGRSQNLIDQISMVFNDKKEFNSGVHEFSGEILEDSSYVAMFKESYGGISNKNTDVIKALSAYIATLNSFNSKFDRNIRGEENSFTVAEKKGFNLFMGKALCATCHFVPLTNGTVPPFYLETEREIIGVPETAKNLKLDDDLGIYWQYQVEVQKGMFKTPTIRNAALTGPYMHNGVYSSLEEVIDFYDAGGGAGLVFDLPYQTLPEEKLELETSEKEALVTFIKTLTDPIPVE